MILYNTDFLFTSLNLLLLFYLIRNWSLGNQWLRVNRWINSIYILRFYLLLPRVQDVIDNLFIIFCWVAAFLISLARLLGRSLFPRRFNIISLKGFTGKIKLPLFLALNLLILRVYLQFQPNESSKLALHEGPHGLILDIVPGVGLIIDADLEYLPIDQFLHGGIPLQRINQRLNISIVPDDTACSAGLAYYDGLRWGGKVYNNIELLSLVDIPQSPTLLQYRQWLFLPSDCYLLEGQFLKLQGGIMIEFRQIHMPFILFKQLCYAGVLINLQFDVILYLHQALCTNQDTYHYLFNKQYTTPHISIFKKVQKSTVCSGYPSQKYRSCSGQPPLLRWKKSSRTWIKRLLEEEFLVLGASSQLVSSRVFRALGSVAILLNLRLAWAKHALIANVLPSLLAIELHDEVINWQIQDILFPPSILAKVAGGCLHVHRKRLLLQSIGEFFKNLEPLVAAVSWVLPIDNNFSAAYAIQRISYHFCHLGCVGAKLLIILSPSKQFNKSVLALAVGIKIVNMRVSKHIQCIYQTHWMEIGSIHY